MLECDNCGLTEDDGVWIEDDPVLGERLCEDCQNLLLDEREDGFLDDMIEIGGEG